MWINREIYTELMELASHYLRIAKFIITEKYKI